MSFVMLLLLGGAFCLLA